MRHTDKAIERAAARFEQIAEVLDPETAPVVDTGDLQQVATASQAVRADEIRLTAVFVVGWMGERRRIKD